MNTQEVIPYVLESLAKKTDAKLVTGYETGTARSAIHDYLTGGRYMSSLSPKETFRYNSEMMLRVGKELWGAISIRWLPYCSNLPEITDGLMYQSRWASSQDYMEDGAFCYHIPVKTKESLPEVIEKLRKWCPEIKVEHTYTVTDVY